MTTTKEITFTIEIDEEAIKPMGADAFISRLINRMNYEHNISDVEIDGESVDILHKTPEPIKEATEEEAK